MPAFGHNERGEIVINRAYVGQSNVVCDSIIGDLGKGSHTFRSLNGLYNRLRDAVSLERKRVVENDPVQLRKWADVASVVHDSNWPIQVAKRPPVALIARGIVENCVAFFAAMGAK